MSIELTPKRTASADDIDSARRVVAEFADGKRDLISTYEIVSVAWGQPALYMALHLESHPHNTAWKEKNPALLDTKQAETQVAGHPRQLEAAISKCFVESVGQA